MSKKSISRQKKMDTRIDFTPMVDMNMLLITFFMLCTTMLKSQTLKIALPTNNEESKTEQNQNQAAESQALTIIIDGVETNDEKTGARSNPMDAKFYYYEGQLNLADPTSFKEAKGIGMGDTNDKSFLRGVLRDKNKEALKLIAEQKKLWQEHKFSKNDQANDSIYQLKAAEIRSRNDLHPPIVMIKPTGRASYSDVVALLDEMQINNISRFQIESLSKDDSTALANKGVQLPPVSANKK
jgi:hypothetical protein